MERKGSRHPKTGDFMTAEQRKKAEFEHNMELLRTILPEELNNTGPRNFLDSGDMSTGFGENRWQKYIDELRSQGENEQAEEAQRIIDSKKEASSTGQEWEEFTVKEDGTTVYDQDTGEQVYPKQSRNLKGNRDPRTGDLLTVSDSEGAKHPLTGKPTAERLVDGVVTDPSNLNDAQSKINIDNIKEKYGNIIEGERKGRELRAEKRNADASTQIEQEDSVDNWMANFESMSDVQFESIVYEELAQYGENAQDAYTEIKLAKGEADSEFTDAQMDAAETDRQAMEMESDFDAEIAQDQSMEDDISESELDRLMMEAESDRDSMEVAAEKRNFPMMNMSDKDKGMFTFQKTDTIANKKQQDSINTIVGDTGMNEEQARQLMTKLKGICG
jgi:hypothetical protein